MKEWNKERSAEITEGNYLGAAIKAGKRKDRSPHESQRRARKRQKISTNLAKLFGLNIKEREMRA